MKKKKILGDEEEREENLCPRLEWERLDGSVVYDPGLRSPLHPPTRYCSRVVQLADIVIYKPIALLFMKASLVPLGKALRNRLNNNDNDNEDSHAGGKDVATSFPHPRYWYEPEPLNQYIKTIFNVIITSSILFILYKFLHLISLDVQWRLMELELDSMNQWRRCELDYKNNKCFQSIETIPPRLRYKCQEWSHCIEQYSPANKRSSQSAKLWVQTLAEVVNTFIENITLRSLLFILITVCSTVMVTNTIFGSYKVVYYNNNT